MYEDWLVVLSDGEWREALSEGQKSISTHPNPNATVEAIGSSKKITRRKTALRETKALHRLQASYRAKLQSTLEMVEGGRTSENQALRLMRKLFTEHFELAYALGLKAQGVGSRREPTSIVKQFSDADRKHIKTAVSEEVRYMKGFIKAILNETSGMTIERRLDMYVRGLAGVFGGARVAALPQDALMWWTGPMDSAKCESCEYLMKSGPYTKHTLPATPRDGTTLCLTNCRDKVVVRKAMTEEIDRVVKSRRSHVRALNRIREDRKKRRK